MNVKISLFVICVEAIIYLLLYNLYECTFKRKIKLNWKQMVMLIYKKDQELILDLMLT